MSLKMSTKNAGIWNHSSDHALSGFFKSVVLIVDLSASVEVGLVENALMTLPPFCKQHWGIIRV